MIILFLDDQEYRHESAKKAFKNSGHTILHAYCKEDVSKILDSQDKIDLAMFDHDLDDDLNGSDIASFWLNDYPNKYPKRVIVHSNNYQGAHNITSKFLSADVDAEYRPFEIGRDYWKELIASL